MKKIEKLPYSINKFSLIEVVVAMTILSIGLAGLFSLSTSAQKRSIQAQEKWQIQHIMMQAAEFYLLHNEEAPEIDEEFFPYQDEYSVEVENLDAEDLPDGFVDVADVTALRSITITLTRNRDGKVVDTIRVDRYVPESQ